MMALLGEASPLSKDKDAISASYGSSTSGSSSSSGLKTPPKTLSSSSSSGSVGGSTGVNNGTPRYPTGVPNIGSGMGTKPSPKPLSNRLPGSTSARSSRLGGTSGARVPPSSSQHGSVSGGSTTNHITHHETYIHHHEYNLVYVNNIPCPYYEDCDLTCYNAGYYPKHSYCHSVVYSQIQTSKASEWFLTSNLCFSDLLTLANFSWTFP